MDLALSARSCGRKKDSEWSLPLAMADVKSGLQTASLSSGTQMGVPDLRRAQETQCDTQWVFIGSLVCFCLSCPMSG